MEGREEFSDNPKRHFEQILKNVSGIHESYKKNPEHWIWTQSFKEEMDEAVQRELISQDDAEELTKRVREVVKKDREFYEKVKGKLAETLKMEELDEWWEENSASY
jgi:predicted transcriptional regulator